MLPRTDILKIQPVGTTNPILPTAPAGDLRQQEFERALAGQLGRTMKADVLAKLGDGSFMVKVADTPARMMLPPSTQVGTSVTLQLVATSPRPTFQINNSAAGQAPSVAYTEADASYEPSSPLPSRGGPLVYSSTAHGPALPLPLPGQPAQQAPAPQVTQQVPQMPLPAAAATPASTAAIAAALAAAGPAALGTSDADAPGAAPKPAASHPAAETQGARGAPVMQARPGSLAALLLSQAPLVPASQLPDIDPHSTPSQLSPGARVITDVLATAARLPSPQTAVVASTPLLDARPVDVKHVAQLLKDAVGRSGLFYESHLREWSVGERPLADLAREPQMQRMAEGQPPRNPAADPSTAGFINLQLSTQEQGKIVWMGNLLPGQPVQWEIEREDGQKGRAGDGEEPVWRSGMTFRFEGLGDISASVVLQGGNVHLRIDTGSAASAEVLRLWSPRLDESLAAAGAPLASLAVRGGEAGNA